MEYIVNYIKEHSHGSLLLRKQVYVEPHCGDVVFIRDNYYRIKNVKYDYEVWQSVGIKVFDAVVNQIQEQTYEFDFCVVDENNISLFGIKDKCPKEVFIPSYISINGHMTPVTFVSWITFSESCEVLYLPDTVRDFVISDEEGIKEVFLDNSCQLEDFTFANCINLVRVVLPMHLNKIPGLAFAGCIKLHDVVTPNKEMEFCHNSFIGCRNLNMNLPFIKDKYVIENGLLCNKSKNEIYTYLGTDGRSGDHSEIILPHNVTYIGNGFNNTDLTSIDLSQTSVTEIEDDTFSECHNLRNIALPSSLKRIGDRAFANCENLQLVSKKH